MTKRKESGAVRKTAVIQGDNHSFALLKKEGECERVTISVPHCKKRTGKFEGMHPGGRSEFHTVKKGGEI